MGGGVRSSLNRPVDNNERERESLNVLIPQGVKPKKSIQLMDCQPHYLQTVEDKAERQDYTRYDLKQLNNYKKTTQSTRVYSVNGLSICLNASGNNGWYTDEKET